MRKIVLLSLLLHACGPSTPPPKDSEKFVAVKPLIEKYCQKCHPGQGQGAFDNEVRWKSSQAKARIQNGSMPEDQKLPPADKSSFLASFE